MANTTDVARETNQQGATKLGSGADRAHQAAVAVMVIMLVAVIALFAIGIADHGWGH